MVHNFSAKKVVSARVVYWLRAPSGCAAQSASFSGGTGDLESVYLEPGSEARLWAFPANPNFAVSTGVWVRSALVQVQIGIGAVDFADGTSWRLTDNKALDPGQLASDSENCRTGLGPRTWIRHQWASGTIRETTSEGSADSSSTDCHGAPPQPPHPIRPNGPPVKTYPLTPTITTAPWNSTHVEDFAAGPRCSRPPLRTAQAASIHLTFDY